VPTQAELQAQVTALVVAQAAARRSNEAAANAAALAALRGFSSWYDTAAITKWATSLARLMESHQKLTARTTNAYLARVMTLLSGKRVATVPLVDVSTIRTGVTHPGVYGRIADTYRYQVYRIAQANLEVDRTAVPKPPGGVLPETPSGGAEPAREAKVPASEPTGLVEPEKAAEDRLSRIVADDIALAARDQAREFLTKAVPRITNYRRVIHPELSTGGTCGLCAAASNRLYQVAELMPLHNRCNCTVLPIYGGIDLGEQINAQDLKLLYGLAGSTGRADLAKVRYQVDSHGELGPVLGAAKQRKVPAKDARSRKSPSRRGSQAVVGDFADRVTAR
jgi:hypothetical protein